MDPTNAPDPLVSDAELAALRAACQRGLPAFLADLARLVNTDCGSYTKAGVDQAGRWTAVRLAELGAAITIHEDATLGDTVVGEIPGATADGPAILLIAHLDTVFEPGTAAARPFASARASPADPA